MSSKRNAAGTEAMAVAAGPWLLPLASSRGMFMTRSMVTLAAAVALAALPGCRDEAGAGGARDQIRAVGSSTVYPFITMVAEQFVNKNEDAKAPVIESTGTGAGMKLFCAGVGAQHPDIEDASRRITKAEFEQCQANGVTEIMEIQVGIDGIALAESQNGPNLQLNDMDIYRALAATPFGRPNTARMWRDVNPALPAIPIQVNGPPSTSGTRDALAELILAKGCEKVDPSAKALKESNKERYDEICTRVRDDGVYVDKGENDNLIVQTLATNPNAIGIFGYSYLEENADRLRGIPLDGVTPSYETISTGRYPGARPLYLYVKKAHLQAVPGLKAFLNEFAASWGPDGPLARRGLIAAPAEIRQKAQAVVDNGTVLTAAELH